MLRALLIAVFVVLGWFVLRYLATVLAPILAAFGIAYMLNPVLDRLLRRGVPRLLGAGLLVGGVVLLLVGFVSLIVGAILVLTPKVANQLAQFFDDLPRMLDNLNAWTKEHFHTELPSEWKSFVKGAKHSIGAGPLRGIPTAALGGVFHLLGMLAE